jgi:hypothetical protein
MTTKHDMRAAGSTSTEARHRHRIGWLTNNAPSPALAREHVPDRRVMSPPAASPTAAPSAPGADPSWLVALPSRLPFLADPNELLLASLNPPPPASFMTRLRGRLSYPSGTARRSWPVRAFEWIESRDAWQRWLLTTLSGGALVLGLYQSAASSASLQSPSSARAELRAASPPPPPGPQPRGLGASDPPAARSPLASNAQRAEPTLSRIDSSTQPTAKPSVKPKRSFKKHAQKARATRHGGKTQHRRHASRLSTPRS